jgi:hypothetical protein
MKTTLLLKQAANHANIYDDIFIRQKAYFASNITKSFEWRINQLAVSHKCCLSIPTSSTMR